ncbi:MAG: elongation factor EF-2 [Candidatus Aenigmatarchaeota archaeon]
MANVDTMERVKEVMTDPSRIRNVATSSHVHHGKTTLTDNLMGGAGMLSDKVVGDVETGMFTWFDEQERQRQLTIYGANVSMVHEYEGRDYLINLMDTPGHVDFGGDVTRAMRAVDGTIVLVCAVEGLMPQTETVFRQALRERVKPVLFINKVDRLIRELKLSPEMMQERFMEWIEEVNRLIRKYADDDYKTKWMVNVNDGTVAFGSATRKWAISIPYMQKTGITFKQIIDMVNEDKDDELAKLAPMHKVVLDMIIKHLPDPKEAQAYRVPKIWKGDLDSDLGKAMLGCDPDGKLAMIITKMVPDTHVGFVAAGRIFSGRIARGKDVHLMGLKKDEKLQQVAVYKGLQRIPADEIVAGNIAAIVGISDAFTGETVCDAGTEIEPFEEIKHLFEPVVTKSVEPKNAMDLPKLVSTLKQLSREDNTLKIKINQETGEYLISGLGELHIESKVERKLKDMGLDVEMSKPIVVYREAIFKQSPEVEGRSPNKHNKFVIVAEPVDEAVMKAMNEGAIPSEFEQKKKKTDVTENLVKLGMKSDEARDLVFIHNKCMLFDDTKGVQYLNEVMELVKEAFTSMMDEGPLCKEPCTGVKIVLNDAELHEDPVHRGPGQIIPAFRATLKKALMKSDVTLLEPKQSIRIDIPEELIGAVTREVENRRGQVLDISIERGAAIITAKMPIADMFGFDATLKSVTSGRGFYSMIEIVFEKLPADLRDKAIDVVRKRKGLAELVTTEEDEA